MPRRQRANTNARPAGALEQLASQAPPPLPFSDVLHISFASLEASREPASAERALLGDYSRDTATSIYYDATLAARRFVVAYRVTVVSAARLPDSGLFWVRCVIEPLSKGVRCWR